MTTTPSAAPNGSKYFVLDTNVLLHNPDAIYSFTDNNVVIPITVVEELDRFKSTSDKKGMNARHVLREMDRLIRKGALHKGVKLKSGGRLMVVLDPRIEDLPPGLIPTLADNKILAVALQLQNQGLQVFFISKDVNARIKGEALGIQTQDYEKQKVEYASLYRGWREMVLSPEDIETLSKTHRLGVAPNVLLPNECVTVKSANNPKTSLLAAYEAISGELIQIKGQQMAMGIQPLNLEQRFAYDLLMNDKVKLVSLLGSAGTGKTLLAIACGLEQILGASPKYEKLLVARPIMPLGKDIGYLPGTKDQKLSYWMQPIFDNLNFIMNKDDQSEFSTKKNRRSDKAEYLLESGLLEVEAITYIRGRSIPNQFIIIDEAQNLTPHEIKTIVSRVGEGTKIVLTGDPEQIDNPYLDSNSNGLSYTAERMKSLPIAGHMLLSKSERSELASIAAEIL